MCHSELPELSGQVVEELKGFSTAHVIENNKDLKVHYRWFQPTDLIKKI